MYGMLMTLLKVIDNRAFCPVNLIISTDWKCKLTNVFSIITHSEWIYTDIILYVNKKKYFQTKKKKNLCLCWIIVMVWTINNLQSKTQGLTKKFIDWPRYSHGTWPNKVYFSTQSPCSPHTFSISVAVLWFHWSEETSTTEITS